jgi:hypothetical protein
MGPTPNMQDHDCHSPGRERHLHTRISSSRGSSTASPRDADQDFSAIHWQGRNHEHGQEPKSGRPRKVCASAMMHVLPILVAGKPANADRTDGHGSRWPRRLNQAGTFSSEGDRRVPGLQVSNFVQTVIAPPVHGFRRKPPVLVSGRSRNTSGRVRCLVRLGSQQRPPRRPAINPPAPTKDGDRCL